MANTSILSDELHNNIITFVDGFGETVGTFDFFEKRPYYFGNITHDIEVRLIKKSNKSKYNKMLDLDDNYYYGDYNIYQLNNIMGKIYKISVQHHIFGEKYDYILLIIDNPYYEMNSEDINKKGKYKLLIYSIHHHGIYFKYINNIGVYTSST
jgi:hypothetical protein